MPIEEVRAERQRCLARMRLESSLPPFRYVSFVRCRPNAARRIACKITLYSPHEFPAGLRLPLVLA
jgi:hypothetical protein